MPAKIKLSPAEAEARVLVSMREDVVPRVQALRRLLTATLPEAEERAHPGWSNFNYYVSGELGYIASQDGTVVLGLTRGNELADPEGLLTAKKGSRFMRQVRLSPDGVVPEDAIVALLLEAAALNRAKGPPEREWRKRLS